MRKSATACRMTCLRSCDHGRYGKRALTFSTGVARPRTMSVKNSSGRETCQQTTVFRDSAVLAPVAAGRPPKRPGKTGLDRDPPRTRRSGRRPRPSYPGNRVAARARTLSARRRRTPRWQFGVSIHPSIVNACDPHSGPPTHGGLRCLQGPLDASVGL